MMDKAAHAVVRLMLVLLAGIPGPARAAPFEIGIDFALTAPSMTEAWPDDTTKEVAAEIRQNLIAYFNANFPFWKAGAPWHFSDELSGTQVVVRFEIAEANNFIKFKVIPSFEGVPARPEGLSPIEWLKPGDQPPGMASAADVITGQIIELLLDEMKYRSILDRWLHDTVPIAVGAQWDRNQNELRLVLPLGWSEYRVLRRSVFKLDCQTPSHHPVVLESHAMPIPGQYHPANAAPFDAVVVAPVNRHLFGNVAPVAELDPEELRGLQLGAVYLSEYENPGFDQNWAIVPPGDES